MAFPVNTTHLLTNKRILWFTHIGAILPLAWLIFDGLTGRLSVNPIQDITLRTGKPALVLIVLSLACTPLNIVFGWREIVAARKWLGLYGFGYAREHFVIFIGVDYGFQWDFILADVGTKRYVLVGLAALLLLTPLAITSTRGWMRRLGKRWKQLHRGAYLAGVLAVFHYIWVVKSDYRQPLAWGVLLGLFLLVRVPPIRRAIVRWRSRRSAPRPRRASKPVKVGWVAPQTDSDVSPGSSTN